MNNSKYRPWGNLDWVVQNIPDEQYCFIGCLGTEDRCIASFSELQKINKISSCKFIEVVDVDNTYSARAAEKREINFNLLSHLGVTRNDVTTLDLLVIDEEIAKWIESFCNSQTRVIVDITSLPKRFFFPIIRLLLRQINLTDLLVTYTVPESYHSGSLAEKPSDWRALPLFGPEVFPEPKYELAIVGVGFLPFGLPDLLKTGYLEARPHLFFPFPATPATYFKNWDFVRQIDSSLPLNLDNQLVRVNGFDPSDVFNHICFLTECNNKNTLIAPYGPKPMSLGMAIYATLTESPVFYTQPRIYHPDYSKGVKKKNGIPEIYTYCLKLNANNLYTL